MIGRMVLTATAAGIVLLFGGSLAGADQSVSIGFSWDDDAVYPGSHVRVLGTCDAPDFTTAAVRSPVLDATDIGGHGGHDPTLISDARVKLDAAPGVWPVSFRCGAVTVTGYLQIAGPKMVASPPLHGSEIEALLAGFAAAVVFLGGLAGLIYRGRRPET